MIEFANGSSSETVSRHEVTIAPTGERELELDLRETFPVRLTLVSSRPEGAREMFWQLVVKLEAEGAEQAAVVHGQTRSDGSRETDTRWLAPGVYRVEVTGPGIRWSRPDPVHVVRGEPNEHDLGLPLVGRKLRVLGADGAPLATTVIAYWTSSDLRVAGRTAADGTLEVTLLAGTLSVALPPPVAEPAPPQGPTGRSFIPPPVVDPVVLAGLAARASVELVPGEAPLELRLRPE
jgi:hypothetical protein